MRRADFWPTSDQGLLLTAALGQSDAAFGAWQQWRSCNCLESADRGSLRLMPLVYFNLRRLGSADAAMPALKEHAIRARLANRALLKHLADVLLLFEEKEIPTLVLKGAALGALVYRDPGLRPMGDFDIAVPHAQAAQAMKLLLQRHWSLEKIPLRVQARPESVASLQFSSSGGVQCDLHFSPFAESLSWGAVAPLWAASVPVVLEGAHTRTLSATDHLLHTLSHGARVNVVPPMRWVADAVWLMRGEAPIAWDRLVAQAARLRLSLVAAKTLAYVRDAYGAAVPAAALAELRGRASRLELLEFAVRRGSYAHWAPLIAAWGRHVRQNDNRTVPALLAGFPFYLQEQWSARSLRETAWIGVRKLPFLPR